jgi:hypothetical protein
VRKVVEIIRLAVAPQNVVNPHDTKWLAIPAEKSRLRAHRGFILLQTVFQVFLRSDASLAKWAWLPRRILTFL